MTYSEGELFAIILKMVFQQRRAQSWFITFYQRPGRNAISSELFWARTERSAQSQKYYLYTGRRGKSQSQSFADAELDSYLVNDLSIKYNYFNSYDLFFDINNLFDKKYETALDYTQMDRSFNFGIKKSY